MNKELQDLAWSCLPKEFKEEVKYEYLRVATKASKEEYDLGFMHAYEGMFSIHNLTSDAGGDDEVLTVSRKRVQEMYADIINDIRDYNGENPEMVGTTDPILRERAAGMKAQLHILFGSKCLPDEACNIASSDVASTEPNPAEPKFKHGDMVIYKRTGKKKVVSGTDKYGRYIVVLPNNQSPMYVDESDLEPYTEPTANYLRSEGALNTAVLAGNYSSASTCDKQFDNIIKDGFKNHNRLHIAAILAAGMLASEVRCYPVDRALELADALIDKCEKGVNNA